MEVIGVNSRKTTGDWKDDGEDWHFVDETPDVEPLSVDSRLIFASAPERNRFPGAARTQMCQRRLTFPNDVHMISV